MNPYYHIDRNMPVIPSELRETVDVVCARENTFPVKDYKPYTNHPLSADLAEWFNGWLDPKFHVCNQVST